MLALLLALALGAAVALWLILAGSLGAHAEGGRETGAGAAAAPPAPVELVGPATVVATSSCVGADPRDTVAVDGPAGRRLMPLDGCGSPLGARMTVRMAFVGGEPADAPARVLGTGSSAALVTEGAGTSPLTGRLAILLTGVAGLGMAGLLVAVVHERRRRAARAAAPARPTRPTTTTRRTRDDGPRRTAHRPAARPARSTRAGRPAGLDAGRRVPAQRTGSSRSTRARGAGGGGTRRPAAGPHRG
ncbi:hypothetical protein C8D89_10898 [Actinomycetospora cinnamomea]|uniref:Uncharacterized protein n=1 Tax=Actinomycetospora cinnamomea TaxID=663609 RepID=A0A2U1F8K0_9PSEU|nr:hypothetical protein C8D89_10898 [Actinomycetospora cinnamomea]